jgi:hypothetical protein
MHLKNLPTYFIKGDDRRAVYYTVIADELRAQGFVEESVLAEPAAEDKKIPERPVVAGVDAFEDVMNADQPDDGAVDESEQDIDLDSLTRAELIDLARAIGISVKQNASKAEILKLCKERQ